MSDQLYDGIPVEDLPEDEQHHHQRLEFFRFLFGNGRGLLCIAGKRQDGDFKESFFEYPDQLEAACRTAQTWNQNKYNVYFCVNLLRSPQKIKGNVSSCSFAWSDLDTCPPGKLYVSPTVVITSSPNRFQAFWKFDEPQDIVETELLCKRIAYAHREDGADVSGWDLVQLLRVPLTRNFKPEYPDAPQGRLAYAPARPQYRPLDFAEHYPAIDNEYVAFKPIGDLPGKSAHEILTQHRGVVADIVWALFTRPPEDDWSQALWQLEVNLAEAGLSPEEMFVVAQAAACNKYERDGRGEEALWKEVQKAYAHVAADRDILDIKHQKFAELIADHEQFGIASSFVEDYIKWASARTDAAPVYHEATAFMILSTVLSRSVRLPTSFSPEGIIPNLWFLILGDTTLTRKSTAMNMGIDIIRRVCPEVLTANEATLEGMFISVAARGGDTALFHRDEFSGMLAGIRKRDYLAGMIEMLTQLYDGRSIERQLARQRITVHEPVFIIFAGGIRERILELMNHDYIQSGFAPRFVFFSAETDLDRYQPLGPPVGASDTGRESLVDTIRALYKRYDSAIEVSGVPVRTTYKAELTPAAWARYNKLEREMIKDGVESSAPHLLTPVMQRLAISVLKAGVLIAATRESNPVDERIIVEEADVLHAIRYGHTWRDTALEVVISSGATALESQLKQAFKMIKQRPGMSRAELMRVMHLSARDADMVFETLEQRALIRSSKKGKGAKYWPISERF